MVSPRLGRLLIPLLFGCGSDGIVVDPPAPPRPLVVAVAPRDTVLTAGDSVPLRGTVDPVVQHPVLRYELSDSLRARMAGHWLVALMEGSVAVRVRATGANGEAGSGAAAFTVRPRTLRVEPADPMMSIGSRLRFRALGTGPEPPAVRWEVVNPDHGTITPDGEFTACWPTGSTIVRATLDADRTIAASARVGIIAPAIGWLQVADIRDAATDTRSDLSRLAGPVDVTVSAFLRDDIISCRSVTNLALVLRRSDGTTMTLFTEPVTAARNSFTRVFRWATGGVPDGDYTIHALATISGRWEVLSGGPTITVANP